MLRATASIARNHPGGLVGVVTHGGFIATLLTMLNGESPANWRKWVVPNAMRHGSPYLSRIGLRSIKIKRAPSGLPIHAICAG